MMDRKDHDPLAFDGKKVEDAFFNQQDKALIERQKAQKRAQERKEALAAVTGIKSGEALQMLVDLDIGPETLAPLSLFPLVEMAWADGAVSENEEALVLAAAETAGIGKESPGYGLLRQWLAHKPHRGMWEAWTHYVRGVCGNMTVAEKDGFKKGILSKARQVAEASGGVLGMGAVSLVEKTVLAEIEKTFAQQG